MHDSIRLKEELNIDSDSNVLHMPTATSGRLVGEVTVNEYNKSGKLLFSETTHNDITLSGSIFILEQMFKRASRNYRFLHPNQFPTSLEGSNDIVDTVEYGASDSTPWNGRTFNNDDRDLYIADEFVFGFMVGHGGEMPSAIIAPTYENTSLKDAKSDNSYLPLRITNLVTENVTDSDRDPSDDGVDYYLKVNNGSKNYFYVKGFTGNPTISTKWSDGSGEVLSGDIGYNVPILSYAEVTLDIDEQDIRQFFPPTQSEECYINQLGLVAGKMIFVKDPQGLYYHIPGTDTYTKVRPETFETIDGQPVMYRKDFNDVKLVTTLNFKSKDLSNDENTIKFTYKIYCL